MSFRIENVESRDAGKFICTLQTYPKQTLIVFLQVDGEISLNILINQFLILIFKIFDFTRLKIKKNIRISYKGIMFTVFLISSKTEHNVL